MKLPGFLLIGITAVIIAVDALEISTTEPPKTIDEYKRICCYANSAPYLPGKGKSFPEDMDASLCTHCIYTYAKMSDNFAIMPSDSNDDGPGGMYARFNNLKKNSGVVTLISVQIQGSDLMKMTKMLETESTRQQFINSSMNFARDRNFDGVMLAFLYPGSGTSPPEDKKRFTLLLEEFYKANEEEAKLTEKQKLVITAVFSGTKYIIDNAYELNLIYQYVDFLILLTYNFDASAVVTVHHSALFAGNKTDEMNTVEGIAEYYASKGVPHDKIVIGIRMLGRGYVLRSADNNGIGAPIVGPSPAGEYTQEPGYLAYYEICTLLNDSSSHIEFLENEKVSYYHNDTLWISYDNQRSMVEKANFVKRKGYAGWSVWPTGLDDFNGTFCNQGRYPLIRTLSDTLMGSVTGHNTTAHEDS